MSGFESDNHLSTSFFSPVKNQLGGRPNINYRRIKVASWNLYGNIWSCSWRTWFMDRVRFLATLLQVRVTSSVSLQGHICSAWLLEEQRMCLSWGLFTEERKRSGKLARFLPRPYWFGKSLRPLCGVLNEEVGRQVVFSLSDFLKVERFL